MGAGAHGSSRTARGCDARASSSPWLALPRGDIVIGHVCCVDDIILACDEDLEPLEQSSCFGGLRARIPNKHVCPDADLLQPLDQRRVEREGQKPDPGLKGPEESITALMASPPRSLELLARTLPLVELPLPDLPPALETTHLQDSFHSYYYDHNNSRSA